MPRKGPHISISPDFVVNRILRINLNDFQGWPQSVRQLAIEIAEELFLVVYNPYIDARMVRTSVDARFAREVFALAHHYANSLSEGITLFWSAHESEMAFRDDLVQRLAKVLPAEAIVTRPGALVVCATDATDLRMELPLLVVEPVNALQVSALVTLANELKFALIPSGGASGMTGGAVPVRRRSVVVRLTRLDGMEPVNTTQRTVTLQAGCITQTAVDAVKRQGYLLTLDPASRTASSIGGNVSENAGGPCAFEYGTTLDNLYSWHMVTPTGEHIEVVRMNHPRHKILPHETAVFEVRDPSGGVRSVVELRGDEIRLPGLGKDVTNKALGGLPGSQKEGVDGIILDATFVVHDIPRFSRVMVLEFFGHSMHEAAVVIGQIVALRNRIRQNGDYAKLSALEEFNAKYVQAIEYQRKSTHHAGLPISVIILQIDGDEPPLLDRCVEEIRVIVGERPTAALIVARNDKEAELFWEDRHRLSAIARRTSGFKLNEDVVIPMDRIPDFALFLEQLNLECAVTAYRRALQEALRLPGASTDILELEQEMGLVSQVMSEAWKVGLPQRASGLVHSQDIVHAQSPVTSPEPAQKNNPLAVEDPLASEGALMQHAAHFFENLGRRYPVLDPLVPGVLEAMENSRVIVASHMHAGDGNCHVNIPVNSNDPVMLEQAEAVALRVMSKAKEMGGAVSGEHGIGITKLAFLDSEKMEAIRLFKARVDPRDVFNPAKLTQKELPVRPFTFSFNRLIEDIRSSGLPEKERLINLLRTVQICTRCGKCKQVCPMIYPARSLYFHPRNKNMALGAVIEAIYYSQITTGKANKATLNELRRMVEHCTGCGRCTAVCPVNIPSAEVALELRAFLEDEGAGGHPIKTQVLSWLVRKPALRVPQAAKMAALGQQMQNRMLDFVPLTLRKKFQSPMFAHKGPALGYGNLYEALHLNRGNMFMPMFGEQNTPQKEAVFYFPGCGGSLFSRTIGLASLALLLKSGVSVVMPREHLCCGYPLLASGADNDFHQNMARNRDVVAATLEKAQATGFTVTHILTACGSCRKGLERHALNLNDQKLPFMDVAQYALPRLTAQKTVEAEDRLETGTEVGTGTGVGAGTEAGEHSAATPLWQGPVLYHAACHTEWADIHTVKGVRLQMDALAAFTGAEVLLSPGCCGESGMGAMTAPRIFNALRSRKVTNLQEVLANYPKKSPILAGCPSCKMGLARSLILLHQRYTVLHTVEWLADCVFTPLWGEKWLRQFRNKVSRRGDGQGVRRVYL